MARIRNQEEFIARANEVHDGKYDYSLVDYTKSSEKVKIICPEHGIFEKTPNKHRQGQGCPVCGRNRTKVGFDEFVKRANIVHGNRYDYSKVDYVSSKDKVEIVCPEHGSFWQTPHSHVILKQNCPKCSAVAGGNKRCGANNVAHREDVKQKKAATCEARFGAKTWAESEEGRQRLHDIIVEEGKLDVMKATCQERYGTDFWTQSEEGRQALRELMSSDEIRQKIVAGYELAYGMHYMQTEAGRERAKSYIDEDRRENMRQTMIERFGVPYGFFSEELRSKMRISFRNTCLRKYGVPYVVFSDEERTRMVQKAWETRRINGTFNTSKPEETLKALLCDVFGADDVLAQYSDAERYPFHCDFYIKSLDLFIELNAHWSHGGHWFDDRNEDDLAKLVFWQEKSKQQGSRYYYAAIDTWVYRDLLKKKMAEENHLNYIVFWRQDLSDAREYLSSIVTHSEAIK